MLDDGLYTETSAEQLLLEEKLLQFLAPFAEEPITPEDDRLQLKREEHVMYLQGSMQELAPGFVALDASRTWICYWLVHSLALLEAPLPEALTRADVAEFLDLCQDPTGGFSGGPGQLPHLAPTYAAVLALVTLGGEETLRTVDRPSLQGFLERMAMPPEQGGGFQVCEGGEVDVRGCYTAMTLAHILNLDKAGLAERSGVVDYIRRCQTYEGGLGGAPGNEAHGGYTFCGLAALMLVGRADVLDLPRLLHWAVCRQGAMEGGFMGRTNKLVDGCYSFWQAAIFPLLQTLQPEILRQTGNPCPPRALLRTALHTLVSLAVAPARLAGGAIHRVSSFARGGGALRRDAAKDNAEAAAGAQRNTVAAAGAQTNAGHAAGAQTNTEPGVEINTGASAGPQTNAGPGAGVEIDAGAAAGAQTNAGARAGAQTNAGPAAGAQTNAGAAAGVQTNARPPAGAQTNAGAAAGAQTNAARKWQASDVVIPELPVVAALTPIQQATNEEAQLFARVSAAAICVDMQPSGGVLGEGEEGVDMRGEGDADGEDSPTLDVCGSWAEASHTGAGSSSAQDVKLGNDLGEENKPQPLFSGSALQLWLLACCQANKGGMRDKPGKARDFYHTCYCLSGLSICQHYSGVVLGGPNNLLARSDPVCNVVDNRLAEALAFYGAETKTP